MGAQHPSGMVSPRQHNAGRGNGPYLRSPQPQQPPYKVFCLHTCNRRRFCPLPGICPYLRYVTDCLALHTQPSAPPHSVHRLAPVGYPEGGRRDDKFEAEDEIPIVDEDDYVQDSDDAIVDEDDEDAQEDDLTLLEARSYGRKTPKQREERRADIQVSNG